MGPITVEPMAILAVLASGVAVSLIVRKITSLIDLGRNMIDALDRIDKGVQGLRQEGGCQFQTASKKFENVAHGD